MLSIRRGCTAIAAFVDYDQHLSEILAEKEVADELRGLLKEFETFSRLRNSIAHNMWNEGTRDASVKPMRLDINSGKVKFVGIHEDENDWTIDELDAEALRLQALHGRQVELLQKLMAMSE